MPTYDCHCAANGRTVEVKHAVSATVGTWREVCELAGIPPDQSPGDAPVAKQLAATGIGDTRTRAAANPAPSMGGCGSGACGHRH